MWHEWRGSALLGLIHICFSAVISLSTWRHHQHIFPSCKYNKVQKFLDVNSICVCLYEHVRACVCVQYLSFNVGLSLLVVLITPNSTIDLFSPGGGSWVTTLRAGLSGPGGYLGGKHVDCTSNPAHQHPFTSPHVPLMSHWLIWGWCIYVNERQTKGKGDGWQEKGTWEGSMWDT